MRTWYTMKAAPSATTPAEISIHDEIGFYGVTAKEFINDLGRIDSKDILLTINSPGGSVIDALAIFNALRTSGKQITMRVLGIAASAASYILLAGHKVIMPENTFVMVHRPMAGAWGNEDALRDVADVLNKIGATLRSTYMQRTGRSEAEIDELLAKDTYLTAAECKELGLCDVVEPALQVTADFDVDRLPENVKAVFLAAKNVAPGIAASGQGTQEQGTQEQGTQGGVDAQDARAFGEEVQALAAEAQMAAFADTWALRFDKLADVRAAIAEAREIRALCNVVREGDKADGFIRSGMKLAEVRQHLMEARAREDERTNIDTAAKSGDQKPTAQIRVSAVYATRRQHATA